MSVEKNTKLVKDLEGAELDMWVAKAEDYKAQLSKTHPDHGYAVYEDSISCWIHKKIDEDDDNDHEYFWEIYEPSWMWHQGGPIIEREKIEIRPHKQIPELENLKWLWSGNCQGEEYLYFGSTLLIAAMRAYIASKYGDEVKDEQN